MQGHLDAFVRVLVVHVVDAVERVNVGAGKPVKQVVELGVNVFVLKDVAGDGLTGRRNLLAGDLVDPAVDCVKQSLRKVHAGAEELHLLPDFHRGDTACDPGVVTPRVAH